MRTTHMLGVAGAATLLLALTPGVAWAEPEAPVRQNARNPVAGSYLVTLKPGAQAVSVTAEAAVAR